MQNFRKSDKNSRSTKRGLIGLTALASVIVLAGCQQTNDGAYEAVDAVAYAPAMEAEMDSIYVPPVIVPDDPDRERYDENEVSPVKLVQAEPVSTFSVDVDTGAYANARRFLTQGIMPPRDAVRTEEMINYFRYDYDRPRDRSQPFTVTTDIAQTPWNDDTYLMRIGLRGYDLPSDDRPAANLVFLMDVSGSMDSPDKLPLVKTALSGLAGELGDNDRVSIVVYAGAAGLVLEPTNSTAKIRRALDQTRRWWIDSWWSGSGARLQHRRRQLHKRGRESRDPGDGRRF
ncbi:MAG: von Willebrand factor type A domain-containing protein [Pseudomonadota bacterium]